MLGGAFELGRYSVYQAHPELAGEELAATILSRVSALIQLPSNETPTITNISDAVTAKQQQPFLAAADDGDVLIVYAQAGEALLYRPSTDKLIAVGPVYSGAQNQAAGQRPIQIASTTSSTTTSTDNATSTRKHK